MASLTDFLRVDDLQGRSFLDVGCGSGLFSLAAHRLGASPVVSMDINPRSVGCAMALRERNGVDPDHWAIHEGSALDPGFLAELGAFDLVYSWGVLHHTGDMWSAIRNVAGNVAEGGQFYIALYNSADSLGLHADGRPGTARMWEHEKAVYVHLPGPLQLAVDYTAAGGMVLGYLLTLRNPVAEIRDHRSLRGMSWMVDIRDWLGGYPYEHARCDEVFRFFHHELGFEFENMTSYNSLVNNEFLFRRPS